MAAREATLGRVRHPDPLRLKGSPFERVLIDDPVADRIWRGDATLGWHGDSRLALYLCPATGLWELYRYEHDGVYRLVAWRETAHVSVADLVPQLILRLVQIDTRGGYDVAEAVNTANAAVDRQLARAREDFSAEFAGRLKHALRHEDL